MQYDVVLADPPWSYTGQQDKWGAASKFYSTMTNEALLAHNMSDWLAEKGVPLYVGDRTETGFCH